MAKAIDHSARRHKIIAESLKLFAARGYAKVNFGMIANLCGLSRTSLYTYFKDKRSIFNESIDEVTQQIRAAYNNVDSKNLRAGEKLSHVCETVFSVMFDNRNFICVISDVLANYRRKGSVPLEKVRSHTAGLLKVIQKFLAEGLNEGEFRPSLDIVGLTQIIYSQFEALALRLAITGDAQKESCIANMNSMLKSITNI